jgi:hypothetical protein
VATSNITNTIKDPGGNPVVGATVTATLQPSPGFRISDNSEVAEQLSAVTDGTGTWTLALERTANITPANSFYLITESLPASVGGSNTWAIQVGASNATLFASLIAVIPAGGGIPDSRYVLNSLFTTKGDILAATAAATPARLGVGSVGRALIADPTQADGLNYGDTTPLRNRAFMAAGALAETIPRQGLTTSVATLSGNLHLVGIGLPAGLTVSSISFTNGLAGATSPTHWWFGLFDLNRVMLALTADQLTAAWAGSTLKTLNIASVASGAASSFVTTYAGLHYLAFMMSSSGNVTIPSQPGAAGVSGNISNIPPISAGTADTGLTTPPAFPFTAAALTAYSHFYGYVS